MGIEQIGMITCPNNSLLTLLSMSVCAVELPLSNMKHLSFTCNISALQTQYVFQYTKLTDIYDLLFNDKVQTSKIP